MIWPVEKVSRTVFCLLAFPSCHPAMPNPVDDAPVGPGKIVLPPDSDDSSESKPVKPNTRVHKLRRVFCAIAVCCTLALITIWFARDADKGGGHPGLEAPLPDVTVADDVRLKPYQTPENANYCADWFAGPGTGDIASVSFELPTAADLLFFLSRGPSSGHIDIVRRPPPNDWRGPVEVNVTARYHERDDVARTKVCRMGAENEHGVLLWAEPRHPHRDPKRDVHFNITCRGFLDIWSSKSFEVVRLKTSNAPIHHGSLEGRAGFFRTSNAKVAGGFAGYEYAVQTSNAPIEATAFMFGETAGSESRVQLKTSNGAITAYLGIISDFANNTLRTIVETSNAPLTLQQIWMTSDAGFFLNATTSAACATLRLNPIYEGPYDLQTTVALARVIETEADDPSRKGRRRTVTRTRTGHHAQGDIYWSHDGKPAEGFERGLVKIATTIYPVELLLG
ncbi:hypothetical protein DFH08DRAFT_1084360 [Mycena albidolilacea]|uniref:Uncharacterized protein n=1 Tax=Mycena albidolilacea TaxID=1033008 RepID=A0AAD7EJJ3_9AGAR|nr:hypothetical protein DFH08DRAFT_1084360 [Mycena albidolilacea]